MLGRMNSELMMFFSHSSLLSSWPEGQQLSSRLALLHVPLRDQATQHLQGLAFTVGQGFRLQGIIPRALTSFPRPDFESRLHPLQAEGETCDLLCPLLFRFNKVGR